VKADIRREFRGRWQDCRGTQDRMQQLVDRTALKAHRRRASEHFPATDCFYDQVVGELRDRLRELERPAGAAMAVVSGQPDFWGHQFGQALQVPDEDMLALTPKSRDMILHCMALHWSNDPVGQLIQCRMALKPGGVFLGVLFGGETLGELREAIMTAEMRVHDGVSPRVLPMADVRAMGDLLPRAGLIRGVADRSSIRKSYVTTRALMHDLRSLGETNAMQDRIRGFSRRGMFNCLETVYHDLFAGTDGRIPATFEMIYLTGWRDPSSD